MTLNIKKYLPGLAIAAVLCTGMTACDEEKSLPPIPAPAGSENPEMQVGNGKWNNPLSAYQVWTGFGSDDLPTLWVKGYIVGYVDVNVSSTLNDRTARFEVPATVDTNILMAADPDERDWEKCITVQLPSGAMRDILNLKTHPENQGALVTIRGMVGKKYCSAYGVRSVDAYQWGDMGFRDTPDGPIAPVASLYEDFNASTMMGTYTAEGWLNVETIGGLSGWYIKSYQGENYVTVSAYLGDATGGPYVNWLISPPIDLDKSPAKTLTFDTQASYKADDSNLEVYLLYANVPESESRVKLNCAIAEAPESGYSSWINSGTIDLSQYQGVVYIGWRYYSAKGASGNSTTYSLDNINIGGATPGQN